MEGSGELGFGDWDPIAVGFGNYEPGGGWRWGLVLSRILPSLPSEKGGYQIIFSILLINNLKMPIQTTSKHSTFLLFPWGLLSIVLILALNLSLSDSWFRDNWSWITLVLIIPAAIFENFKVGYSTMRIMFLKMIYSLLSFLLVGMAFGAALAGWHLEKFQNITNIEKIRLPWFVLLALAVMLLIQVAQIFSMLKAVKREFMQLDPDQ